MPTPLPCNTNFIQFVGQPTQWYNINLLTGNDAFYGYLNPQDYVNAIGYNPLDNFIYGYDITVNQVVQIDADRNITYLGLPTGLPANGYNAGCLDQNGFFYIMLNGAARFYTIDLRPGSASYMRLVNPLNGYVPQTTNYGNAINNGTMNVSDWAADDSGFLYGIQPSGVMQRLNLANGNMINMTTTGPKPNASFGAVSIDKNGFVYAIENNDGGVYRYTINGIIATGEYFSTTVFASQNDGCMCRNAELLIDFGDAPDLGSGNGPGNYNTLLENNGPRHEILNTLYLGTQVTAETDANQNNDATGDDQTQGIQDDGVAVPLPTLSTNASSYTLDVMVTNDTGQAANLYGWIDFNQNGLFEPEEAAQMISVPYSPLLQTVTMTFDVPTVLSPGSTFARLRLTTDVLPTGSDDIGQDVGSIGPASDGEVEDYILSIAPIADLEIAKTADTDIALPGTNLTYTITITNKGPNAAQTPLLVDNIYEELKNVVYSLDMGATWDTWGGSIILPSVEAGMTVTVLIKGTVNMYASGVFGNTASVNSPTIDPDLSNNTATISTLVGDSANISIVKTASPSEVTAGETITFTLLVSNVGPSDAQNVILTDDIPSEIANAVFSTDSGITWLPWSSPYHAGTLVSGTVMPIQIRGTVLSNASQTISNTATVDSDTPDPDLSDNSSTVDTPINESADLSITKIGDANPVMAGDTLTYTLTVANNGPSDAENITIIDKSPSDVTNVQYSDDDGATWQSWDGSYNLASLKYEAYFVLLIRGIVNPSAIGTLTNAAIVDSDTPDPDLSNNIATEITPINTSADLSVDKNAPPEPVSLGDTLIYTITVQNHGPDDALNVVITDIVPGELDSILFSVDNGSSWQDWNGSYDIVTLINGEIVKILISGMVIADSDGLITNTVTITSDTPDPDLSNNTAITHTPIGSSADLSITKIANYTSVDAGQMLTYTITIKNLGPDNAENVVLTDNTSVILLTPQFSLDNINWEPWQSPYTLGMITEGAVQVVYIRGVVNPIINPTVTPRISNTATISSSTPDPDISNNNSHIITPITVSADLEVIKTDSPSPIIAGNILTYTIEIINNGPSDAIGVVLADAIPSSVINPEFSIDGGSSWLPWIGTYPIQDPTTGRVAAGGSIYVLIRGTVSPAAVGHISNTATIMSATPDPDLSNNTYTQSTPTITSADMAIVKTAIPSPVNAGETLNYTLSITNNGPSFARNVVITDQIPEGLSDVVFSIDAGNTWIPWTGSYLVGTVATGATITALARGIVKQHTTDFIPNTAEVDSTTPDPDLTNNKSTALTPVNESADLSIVKTSSSSIAAAGEMLIYTLSINNAGPSDAENVIVTDNIPIAMSSPEFSTDNGVTWQPWINPFTVGLLESGKFITIHIQGIIDPNTTGTIRNTATVSSDTNDPDSSNNRSTLRLPVNTSADLSISKTGDMTAIKAGDMITYTIIVTSDGPSDATNVVVTDDIPNYLTDVQFSDDNGLTWQDWLGSYTLDVLPCNSSFTLFIRATVPPSATGTIFNTTSVISNTPDPDMSNNDSIEATPIYTMADLSINKTASKTTVGVGDVITYSITAYNSGPDDAQTVVITDVIPPGLTNAEFSFDEGVTWYPWQGYYSMQLLELEASVTIIIRAVVAADAAGNIVNTAFISSITTDPDLTNNYATIISKAPCPCPPCPPCPDPITRDEALNQIIASIALEELALSHIINAESEKIRYVLGVLPDVTGPNATIDEIIKVNSEVAKMISTIAHYEILLKEKLDSALSGYKN